ncbi:hypothetical protein [Leptospira interrogans]|uniref:hypothetical protein n=1 Tax=Leptospira interrogans TaxID=173 RepID=UPI0002B97948|nr:hypothetical protein [Leptospira interrogans]MCR8648447.1 hypothetical protein [Leptospira interrogans serovar Bataviae]OAM86115.1 hypothetical protein A1343_15895 [Leptospira interrogans serovar Bataviae]QOI40473.1 hypothetical protein Lepto1548_19695 [Leptospira interrogans serovar Bataviae]
MKTVIWIIEYYLDLLYSVFLRFRRRPFNSLSLFKKLSEEEKIEVIYGARYVNRDIYQFVRQEFQYKYGRHEKISNVIVDDYGMGMVPSIILYLKKGRTPLKLPKTFLGFHFYKIYDKN